MQKSNRKAMTTWNVLITLNEGRYCSAFELLDRLGTASKTEFFNFFVMQVHDAIEVSRQAGCTVRAVL